MSSETTVSLTVEVRLAPQYDGEVPAPLVVEELAKVVRYASGGDLGPVIGASWTTYVYADVAQGVSGQLVTVDSHDAPDLVERS